MSNLANLNHKHNSVSEIESIQLRDQSFVWHTWAPLKGDKADLIISHGKEHFLWDIEGNKYIDASSLNLTCGYAHPQVVEAATTQMNKLHGVDLSYMSHEAIGLLAERLSGYLPEGLSKTLFVNSGSEGLEAAIFVSASFWENTKEKRSRVVALERGYHGSTFVSRCLGGWRGRAHPFLNEPFPVKHVSLPIPPHELKQPQSLGCLLDAFEEAILGNPNDLPMAVVVEPFLGVGGGVVFPSGFLRGLQKLCNSAGTHLIIDEVFTGYGRSGKMFAFQHENIIPDILVSSKGLANGCLPITAVTVQKKIYESFKHEPVIAGLRYGHTTSGHAASCAAALATLDILESENLCEKAKKDGNTLFKEFYNYIGSHNIVDVRQFGLVLVLEMCSIEKASNLKGYARTQGLLLRQCHTSIMVVPPLNISKDGLTDIINLARYSLINC